MRRSDIRLAAFLGPPAGRTTWRFLFSPAGRSCGWRTCRRTGRCPRPDDGHPCVAGVLSPECLEALARRIGRPWPGTTRSDWDAPGRGRQRRAAAPVRADPFPRQPSARLPVGRWTTGCRRRRRRASPAAERPGRNLDLTSHPGAGPGSRPDGRGGGVVQRRRLCPDPGRAKTAEFCGRMICSQPNGAGAVVGQFGAGFGYGVAPKAAEGPCAHQAIAHGRTDPSPWFHARLCRRIPARPMVWRPERPDPRSNDAMEARILAGVSSRLQKESGIPIDQLWAGSSRRSLHSRSGARPSGHSSCGISSSQGPNHAT